jgi:hypothetical protein
MYNLITFDTAKIFILYRALIKPLVAEILNPLAWIQNTLGGPLSALQKQRCIQMIFRGLYKRG